MIVYQTTPVSFFSCLLFLHRDNPLMTLPIRNVSISISAKAIAALKAVDRARLPWLPKVPAAAAHRMTRMICHPNVAMIVMRPTAGRNAKKASARLVRTVMIERIIEKTYFVSYVNRSFSLRRVVTGNALLRQRTYSR